jgi:hypothetical protein
MPEGYPQSGPLAKGWPAEGRRSLEMQRFRGSAKLGELVHQISDVFDDVQDQGSNGSHDAYLLGVSIGTDCDA